MLADHIMKVTDSLVRARLKIIDRGMMEHRYDKVVRRRIINYIERWPVATGRLLARSARYFPIFEAQLSAAGMPLELKYVTIQESALRPYAVSRASAAGLWQLMPGTARELGLAVDNTVDERLDAELGCAAGLKYLSYQYDRYQDWALALAAYNCGPGNVNKAIRRSGRKNPSYWQIRKHLPRETANYVPSIIAAMYILNYYHDHGVAVKPMELDMQMTEAVTVYRELSLYRVAQLTGLRADRIVELNPQYIKGYLPGRPGGHRLRLPSRTVPAVKTYLARHPAGVAEQEIALPWASPRLHNGETDPDRFYQEYRSSAGPEHTDLRQLARANRVPVDQLAVWSGRGTLDSLHEHDPVVFYRVADYLPYDPRDRHTPAAAQPLALQAAPPLRVAIDISAATDAIVQRSPPRKWAGFTDRVKRWFK